MGGGSIVQDREITCPSCGNTFWYWTINDFITCQGCKTRIPVEPCNPSDFEEAPPEEVIEDGASI